MDILESTLVMGGDKKVNKSPIEVKVVRGNC